MIGIINYGSGNIGAIANIYKQLKIPHFISADIKELSGAERYILPGVGAFDSTMRHLKSSGLLSMLDYEVLQQKKPILGVCVGMQILAESSEEGEEKGLGWIKGKVCRFDPQTISTQLKLPHMGWNTLTHVEPHPLLSGIDPVLGFYFLHNYYYRTLYPSDEIASATYGAPFTCAVAHSNIMGVQFHPEKSHANGVAIFRNFSMIGKA
ncbi:imidazole glycerol phosphate synthase subunit HisH [Variovorax sp. Varisp41]|uniref:imidazole glycerol phosphate synthase subunit HisH n=1 Tax=unclassified Variovorax TaxID=663243 RepID=UPI0039B4A91D